jgi:hypothetical protein
MFALEGSPSVVVAISAGPPPDYYADLRSADSGLAAPGFPFVSHALGSCAPALRPVE